MSELVDLSAVLAKHAAWSRGEAAGERANLADANLAYAYLRGANLEGANLACANLVGANLVGANLVDANLRGADLRGADLRGANLRNANLVGADLRGANLRNANLADANLAYADLADADLRRANLRGAYLEGANLEGARLPHFQICPEEGAFVAYKKADGAVVTLEIPADAERTSTPVGRKCRASKAKVLAISGGRECVPSNHDQRFVYRVGETVEVADFDDDIRVECTRGIHFWMTKREAQEWL